MHRPLAICLALLMPSAWASDPAPAAPPTMADVLAASTAKDWRQPDPENLILLEFASGRVLMELAPDFAPAHAANIRLLIRQGYFDGLPVLRVQDNYVVQWGDPDSDDADRRRPLGEAAAALKAEYERAAEGAPAFTRLPDPDSYAPETGFAAGFPAARDPATGKLWMTHCYGALGVARDNDPDSGSGTGLYVVIGHSPRHLDRNITLVGRVLQGMELLSPMPRGSGTLGFYQGEERGARIERMRLAADLPASERPSIEVLRTDTARFEALIAARRNRHEPWFHVPTGRIEVCNVPLPVRAAAQSE